MRFLRLPATLQRRVASGLAAGTALWLAGTAGLVGWQAWTSHQARDVAARADAVAVAETRVVAERRAAEQRAASVEARQARLEALVRRHFGADLGAPPQPAPASTAPVARLDAADAAQAQLVASLTDAAMRRSVRAEAALRTVGLAPAQRVGQGGPFLPWRADPADDDPALVKLAAALERLDQAEARLAAMPSRAPADGMQLSSGFGIRFDPFNGAHAMHAGLDFTGAHGSPIRAAAPGRVSFVGTKNGYGQVVEVDHGQGFLTRYAHLSAFTVREGAVVAAGDMIARMGSTGRSTGTHLHFEVRVDGVAVNPRPFLEANADVLEIKADARSRLAAAG